MDKSKHCVTNQLQRQIALQLQQRLVDSQRSGQLLSRCVQHVFSAPKECLSCFSHNLLITNLRESFECRCIECGRTWNEAKIA